MMSRFIFSLFTESLWRDPISRDAAPRGPNLLSFSGAMYSENCPKLHSTRGTDGTSFGASGGTYTVRLRWSPADSPNE